MYSETAPDSPYDVDSTEQQGSTMMIFLAMAFRAMRR